MRRILSVIIAIVVAVVAVAQEQAVDPKAKALLEKTIVSFESKKGISADFVIKVENTRNNKEENYAGNVLLKGEKFRLSIQDVDTYFDGKTQYVWMKKEKEVSISNPEAEDLKDINPLLMMKSCRTDYKMRYLGLVSVAGKTMEKIELYPNDLTSKYSIITLLINKDDLLLDTITLKAKNGIHTQFHITGVDTKRVLNDVDFIFNPKNHPGVEVVDLR